MTDDDIFDIFHRDTLAEIHPDVEHWPRDSLVTARVAEFQQFAEVESSALTESLKFCGLASYRYGFDFMNSRTLTVAIHVNPELLAIA